MKILPVVFFFFFEGLMFGQAKVHGVDTVIKLGGRKIPALVHQVGTVVVTYALPSKPDSIISTELKELEKVIYRNGRVDIFNKPPVEPVNSDEWRSVLITNNRKDVQGLYKRGHIKAQSIPNTRGNAASKENGIIKLQKQAIAIKATIVLITHDEFIGGPGDPRIYYVEGDAYGDTPLEKGTNGNADPQQKK